MALAPSHEEDFPLWYVRRFRDVHWKNSVAGKQGLNDKFNDD
jgi:hypothetical protein